MEVGMTIERICGIWVANSPMAHKGYYVSYRGRVLLIDKVPLQIARDAAQVRCRTLSGGSVTLILPGRTSVLVKLDANTIRELIEYGHI